MAYAATHGCTHKARVSPERLAWAVCGARCPSCCLNGTKFESVIAGLQLCQCATGCCRHWLKLIEGAWLALIARANTRSGVDCCRLGLMRTPVIT